MHDAIRRPTLNRKVTADRLRPRCVSFLLALDRVLGVVVAGGLILVLPVSLLLFLQWPLREIVQAYSREANDVAQALFAIYVSFAITYATRRGTHLAVDALAHRYSPRARARMQRIGSLLVLVPWSLFTL